MVLAHLPGGYELIVPAIMGLGLWIIVRTGTKPKQAGQHPNEAAHRHGRADLQDTGLMRRSQTTA
jgi:hypothetical protein